MKNKKIREKESVHDDVGNGRGWTAALCKEVIEDLPEKVTIK